MIERKKMNDIKKPSARIIPPADILPTKKIPKPIPQYTVIQPKQIYQQPLPPNIPIREPVKPVPPRKPAKVIPVTTWLKWFSITGIVLGIVYVVSLFAYHGTVHVELRSQQVSTSEVFTAVPKENFTGNEKTLPFYVYVSDISLSDETGLFSPQIFEQLRSALPPDAITSPEYLFIGQIDNVDEKFVSIIFFKKQDVENYIYTYLAPRDYRSGAPNIKNIQIISQVPIGQLASRNFFPVRFSMDFYTEADLALNTLPSMITDQDIHTCREILQKVKEINVDKCTVFPFWYSKIPKNPKFIRIITK
jgi:hypothetical protein